MENIIQDLSVDCVVFGFDFERINVLLVDRELHVPETGELIFSDRTLTGYHIYENEELDAAAYRILKELTGLENIYLEQFYTFGQLDRTSSERDTKWRIHTQRISKRVVTVGYFALIDNTKVSLEFKGRRVQWVPIDEVGELGFDHNFILAKALERLKDKVRKEPLAFELLPERFTLSQLQKLYEVILETTFDKRNFRKKVAQMKYLIPLDEKQKGVSHKPGKLYLFSREVYEKTKRDRFDFTI